MKVNEAPEKIYLCPSELAGIDYDEEWFDRPFGDSIEYIRTDAFIERACEKLRQLIYDNLMYQVRLERDKVIDNFIEDFKERIKGE